MNFVKRTLVLVGCLALGILTSYAQAIEQQDAEIKEVSTSDNLEQSEVQIEKEAAVNIIVKASDGSIGNGSGFFIRQDMIATNIHVVAGIYGKSLICHARLSNQPTEYVIKGVIASDPEHDLVILKVEGEGTSVLRLGDSDTVKLGEKVVAIGTHRDVRSKIVKGTISRITTDFFRVKATLLPGYSGGPVLNQLGEVIGICVEGGEIISSGYVIPSNHLKALLKEIPIQEQSLEQWRAEPLIRAYAIVNQGDERVALGNFKSAVEAYDAAIRLKPNFATAYVRRGFAKYKLGNYRGALVDQDIAIRLGLDYVTTYVNRGITKRYLRNYKEAIADYDTAIRLDPKYAEAYFNRGNVKSDLGYHKMAIKDYDMAILLKPTDVILSIVYIKRADAKSNLGDNIGAIDDYNEVILLKSDNTAILAVAHLNRGFARYDLGNIGQAIEDYDEVIRLKPPNTMLSNVYVHRAKAKSKLGNNIGAIEDYDEAIRLSGENTHFASYVYSRRASTKLEIRDNEGVIEDSSSAIQLDPDLAEAYRIRGDAKSNLGNYNEAIKDYNTAIYLKPDYIKAYYKRGRAKVEIGNITEARIDFQTASKLTEWEESELLKDEIELGLRIIE